MKKNILISFFIALIWLPFASPTLAASPGDPLWAKSGGGSTDSEFLSIVRDSSGNFYTAGYIEGNNTYSFGNGVAVNGSADIYQNTVLVKYDNNGNAQWAKSTVASSESAKFLSIARDNTGNIYAAGYIKGNATYDFGNGVTVSGTYDSGSNIVLVKYNSSGDAQWAKSTTAGPDNSRFFAVAVDKNGNTYGAGYISGTGTFNFGNGIAVSGATSFNCILVKYDTNGNTEWVRSTGAGSSTSDFRAVTVVDSNGAIYAAGSLGGSAITSLGNGVYGSGGYNGENAAVVKYNSDGYAQWVKTTISATNYSRFLSVVIDNAGNIYAAGHIYSTGSLNFGDGVSVAGKYAGNFNPLLVKYASEINPEWAKSAESASNLATFESVTVDSANNPIVGGYIYQTGDYDFGNNVTFSGQSSFGSAILLNYNSTGTAQRARGITDAPADSRFLSIAIDNNDDLGIAGHIYGTGNFTFDNAIAVNGTSSDLNILIMKYLDTTQESSSSNNTISSSSSTKIKSSSSSSGNGGNVASDSGSMKPKLLILGSVILLLIP